MKKVIGILCGLAWLIATPACRNHDASPSFSLAGFTMGTHYHVKAIPSGRNAPGVDQVRQAVEGELEAVNRAMSMFRPDSELSAFNRSSSGVWFPVSPATAEVVEHARQISVLSGGAFDVTVAPLVDLWGFGRNGGRTAPPSPEEVARVRQEVGYERLRIRLAPPALRKETATLRCDLSAIAKGYGVDRVGLRLESLGFDRYLVEIGGEVRCRGQGPTGADWQVGIAAPDASGDLLRVIHLRDVAVATSGDYRNYFEKDGRRFSHTINPRDGAPITHSLASVTVIHPSCMHADAMATALNVLGPEAGLALANREKLAAYFIVRRGSGFVETSTAWFAPYQRKK
ncbi:MAG TPA: FAD:protein FMN transferase [Candidatus Aminicenantes bacterium]|nr:FAD:protein FMN transferase [Candidatus Aminicenantes bacterium]